LVGLLTEEFEMNYEGSTSIPVCWLLAALAALSLCACSGDSGSHDGAENTAPRCQDEVDNDGDGHVDCQDQDCWLFVFCAAQADALGDAASPLDTQSAPDSAAQDGLPDTAGDGPAPADGMFAEADGPGPIEPGGVAPFVPPPPPGEPTHWVSPQGNDGNPGTKDLPWRQVSHAAEVVGPGSIVEIADGTYTSPIIVSGKTGTLEAPIVFRATGKAALVDGAGADGSAWDKRDAIFVMESDYVVIHGLRESAAFRAGIRVSWSNHVTVQGCLFEKNGSWGIFTDFSDNLLLAGNECSGSKTEHGIYHSNSGDRAVITGNYSHHNAACGIQLNADPATSASEGQDGISSQCIIDRNLVAYNGAKGGAGINLASVRDSAIRNNVIVANQATGIGMWDDGQGSQWGCKGNLIEHNTIVFLPAEGRFTMTLWNGSTGCTIRNNILVGAKRGSISFTKDSLPGLASDYNLFYSLDGWHLFEDDQVEQKYDLPAWQILTSGDAHSFAAQPLVTAPSLGDGSLQPGSPGIDVGTDSGVKECYDGTPRPKGLGYDLGAYDI
jgi:parallel beta-helix repeat protein